ncbi:hypothetical protein GW7_20079 [Heterocephalus glaber]|uniref:Uncharacterized protein n=1 Tax=Heterocephalus glaber TaxID=10181 RepID=G5BJI2_HETGA|nr:hypothetical protein GW7_20079 [Heterocephalus glaber]
MEGVSCSGRAGKGVWVARWVLLDSGARWMQAVLRVAGDGVLALGVGGSPGVLHEAVPPEHLQGAPQGSDPGRRRGEGGAGRPQLRGPRFRFRRDQDRTLAVFGPSGHRSAEGEATLMVFLGSG